MNKNMAHYIDTDKLIAHIEKLFPNSSDERIVEGFEYALDKVKAIIDSLQQEQPKVDLEEALNGLDNAYFDLDGIAVKGVTYYLTVNDLKDIARDFYELGLNARKEENK